MFRFVGYNDKDNDRLMFDLDATMEEIRTRYYIGGGFC